jgi:hypothetical protein
MIGVVIDKNRTWGRVIFARCVQANFDRWRLGLSRASRRRKRVPLTGIARVQTMSEHERAVRDVSLVPEAQLMQCTSTCRMAHPMLLTSGAAGPAKGTG